jgi:predicted CopG family antitoxin
MSKQVEDLDLKSIKVSEETYELLAEIGKYKESMDDIIKRIATFYMDKNKK